MPAQSPGGLCPPPLVALSQACSHWRGPWALRHVLQTPGTWSQRPGRGPPRPQPSVHRSPDLSCKRPLPGLGWILGAGPGWSVPSRTPGLQGGHFVPSPRLPRPGRPGSDCVPGCPAPRGSRAGAPLPSGCWACNQGAQSPTHTPPRTGWPARDKASPSEGLSPAEGRPPIPWDTPRPAEAPTDLAPLQSAPDEEAGGAGRGPGAALAGSGVSSARLGRWPAGGPVSPGRSTREAGRAWGPAFGCPTSSLALRSEQETGLRRRPDPTRGSEPGAGA